MATWVVGDIHGQKDRLDALLGRLELDPGRDRLWLVGDLVNRGPDSLGVLRWARHASAELGERFVVVLGNHDLHLLAARVGLRRPDGDLDAVLAAADAPDLLHWLASWPFLHRQRIPGGGETLLVHAGLWPSWTVAEAEDHARALE
ncbi:MAG: metallophosphoesterase, partial [Holophagales bacterium]|nr:metallophosphoesterase [Holophagales bacterium]